MEISIDKMKLEQIIPAFVNPDNQIFDLIYSYLRIESERVAAFIGEIQSPNVGAAENLVCFRAALRCLPQLNIVMTPNGIGVVRNNEIAPASQERVNDFRNNLRQNASEWRDILIMSMAEDPKWSSSPQAEEIINTLIWCPTIARNNGITMRDGASVYEAEYTNLLPSIYLAEARVANIISHELLDALKKYERERFVPRENYPDSYKLYGTITEKAKHLIATIVMNGAETVTRELSDNLLDYIQRHEANLPEWMNSSLRKSRSLHYENTSDSPCYFFG